MSNNANMTQNSLHSSANRPISDVIKDAQKALKRAQKLADKCCDTLEYDLDGSREDDIISNKINRTSPPINASPSPHNNNISLPAPASTPTSQERACKDHNNIIDTNTNENSSHTVPTSSLLPNKKRKEPTPDIIILDDEDSYGNPFDNNNNMPIESHKNSHQQNGEEEPTLLENSIINEKTSNNTIDMSNIAETLNTKNQIPGDEDIILETINEDVPALNNNNNKNSKRRILGTAFSTSTSTATTTTTTQPTPRPQQPATVYTLGQLRHPTGQASKQEASRKAPMPASLQGTRNIPQQQQQRKQLPLRTSTAFPLNNTRAASSFLDDPCELLSTVIKTTKPELVATSTRVKTANLPIGKKKRTPSGFGVSAKQKMAKELVNEWTTPSVEAVQRTQNAWHGAAMAWRQKNKPSAAEVKQRQQEAQQQQQQQQQNCPKMQTPAQRAWAAEQSRDQERGGSVPGSDNNNMGGGYRASSRSYQEKVIKPNSNASEAEWRSYYKQIGHIKAEGASSFMQLLNIFNSPCNDPLKVKDAYRMAVRMYHPDSNSKERVWKNAQEKMEAEEVMKIINERKPEEL